MPTTTHTSISGIVQYLVSRSGRIFCVQYLCPKAKYSVPHCYTTWLTQCLIRFKNGFYIEMFLIAAISTSTCSTRLVVGAKSDLRTWCTRPSRRKRGKTPSASTWHSSNSTSPGREGSTLIKPKAAAAAGRLTCRDGETALAAATSVVVVASQGPLTKTKWGWQA